MNANSIEPVLLGRRVPRLFKGLWLAAALLLLSFGGAGTARAQFTGPGIYVIRLAQAPNLVLDIDSTWGRGGASGQPLLLWGRNGGANQKFVVLADGAGFIIRPVHSLMCLDVPAFATSPGTTLQQWPCNGGANQRFMISTGPNTVIRTSHADRLVLGRREGGRVEIAVTPVPLPIGAVFVFERI